MMYNPMAYWGQRDLIPQILVDYGNRYGTPYSASYFVNGVPQQVLVPAEFSGSGATSLCNLVRVCQDFYNETSVQQNPVSAPLGFVQYLGPFMMTQPYFCSTTSKDGLSGFGPIEAWYLDITNITGLGVTPYTLYIQYIDKDGKFASASVAYPNTIRILTQTYPMNAEDLSLSQGRQRWNITPIQKYSGNVTPYPYRDVPVNYRITTNDGFDGYYHITGSGGIDTNIGSGFQYNAGTSYSVDITSFNIPELGNNNVYINPISASSVVPPPVYRLTKCNIGTALTASFTDYNLYENGSILSLTSSAVSGCFTVNSVTSSITPTYTNVTVLDSYGTCYDCTNPPTGSDLRIEYLIVGGGGGGGQTNANFAAGGGGGAGQFISGTLDLQLGNSLGAVIGSGGNINNNGSSSTFLGYTALGGGKGGASGSAGGDGACGGGAGIAAFGTNTSGGTGSAGFNGGIGAPYNNQFGQTGGGGGSSSPGLDAATSPFFYESGAGGNGTLWKDGKYYAAGGGGGAYLTGGGVALGGSSIGGDGAISRSVYAVSATNPTANRGSGGGGGATAIFVGSAGSDGVVIVRYFGTGSQATGGTVTYSGSYTYHTFTSNGSFTYS